MYNINIGCGMTPTMGWLNFDNSPSIRLARHYLLTEFLRRCKLINGERMNFIRFCRANDIRWADATRRIPLPDGAVGVVYSSHVLEHLDRVDAALFLGQVRRVLAPGGIVRLAVPDLERKARQYLASGDADDFMESAFLCVPRPRSLMQRVAMALVGPRHHQWMYDGRSLCRLLEQNGFSQATCVPAGDTRIASPGSLDLSEREVESLYVEAIRH